MNWDLESTGTLTLTGCRCLIIFDHCATLLSLLKCSTSSNVTEMNCTLCSGSGSSSKRYTMDELLVVLRHRASSHHARSYLCTRCEFKVCAQCNQTRSMSCCRAEDSCNGTSSRSTHQLLQMIAHEGRSSQLVQILRRLLPSVCPSHRVLAARSSQSYKSILVSGSLFLVLLRLYSAMWLED
jgi:hypothetical protein